LLDTLDKLSGALAADVNHQDATIDQLLAIKQIAWLLRNTAGEASLAVSNAINTGKMSPEGLQAYTKFAGGIDAAWSALELTAAGMQLPPALASAIAATKTAYFEPQYVALRDRLINAVAKGEKPELTAGFAVVASEVKSLASQTAKATDEISEQIADIQKVAGEAIDAIKSIGGIIGEVNEVATAIAAAVQEQGAATQEITRSTQYAAQGTKNVSENIGGVKTDADAAAAAAENVKVASQTLETQSKHLGSQVTEFLGRIRAA
jgi:Methyl-accepting chemotaxis protein (MCP) signalling domain